MLFGLAIPLRFLRGSAGRFTLTLLALACGVGLVCAIDLVNAAVFRAFTEIIDTMAGRAALQVTAGQGSLFEESIAERIASVPGVELAVPVVNAAAFTTDGSGEQLTVHGVDIADEAAVRLYEPAGAAGSGIADTFAFLNQPDSVILTEEFAERRGLRIGDAIELDTPSGRRRFVVRGLLAPQGIARVRGGNLVVMDVAAAEMAFTRPGLVNRVDIVVKPDADVQQVADAVTGVLSPGLSVERPEQRKVDLHKVIQSSQALAQGVGLLGLVAGFLIAFSRLTNVFEARTGDLAVLRAVGVRSTRVFWELAKEGLLMAAGGIAFGIPLGIALGYALLPIGETATALTSKLPFADATLRVRPTSILLAALLGFVAVAAAIALPAWRAARLSVADTLRQRGREQDESTGALPWVLRGLVVLLTAIALAIHLATGSTVVGIGASALLVIVAALVARPLFTGLAGVLASAMQWGGPTGRMAFETLVRNPRRTALAISTIGVGLGTVVWVWILAQSFEQSVVEVMPGVLRGDLAISSGNIAAGYVESPVDDTLTNELRSVPGVRAVAGEQAAEWHYRGGTIALNAFDPAYFVDPAFGSWRLIGRQLPDALVATAHHNAVIVSENFVRNLAVAVGDTITLDTPNGPLALRVAGVTRDFLSPRGTIEMSREVYARHWNDRQIVRALVRLEDGVAPEAVRAAIARQLGRRYSLQILSLGALMEWFASQVRRAFAGLHVLAGLVLFVVLIGVGDALAASVLERTRDLGVIRAVGVRRGRLGRLILAEATILAGLGLLIAWSAGLTLGILWVSRTFPALLGWTLSLRIPVARLAAIGVVALIVCLAAALGPARRAARLDPVEALRAE